MCGSGHLFKRHEGAGESEEEGWGNDQGGGGRIKMGRFVLEM